MSGMAARGGFATRSGPLMAASDALRVIVVGRGGHGAAPHAAADPLPAACAMVLELQTALSRTLDPLTPAVLTVGTFHAGAQRNVIPDTVEFEATVRTFDPAVRRQIATVCQRVCDGIAAAHGVRAIVRYDQEYPVTVNDPAETTFAQQVIGSLLGPTAVVELPEPITGSEDFARVLEQVPGAMLFLGAMTEDRRPGSAAGNHSPRATFDDAVLPIGAAVYAALAARRLQGPA